MKKLITLLTVIVMLVSFTACGGREKVDISTAKNIHDLKGASIAAQSATFHLEVLSQIEGVKISDYEDFPALLIALNSGVIDGYVAEEPTAYAECLRNPSLAYLPFVNNDTGFTAGPTDTGIAVAFATGSPLDKAGAYGIQDKELAPLVKQVCGDIDNVIGNPSSASLSILSTNPQVDKEMCL